MGDIADYHINQMTSGKWSSGSYKNNSKENEHMAIDNNTTKVITGKVRLSYVHIFEPASIDGEDAKYSTAILIPKSDKETLRKIKTAVDAAKELGKSKWGGKVPANCKTPLRDGDEERPDDEAYAGHYFLNATSKNKPGIAKPIGKGPDGKTKFQEITDTTEVYSGCYAKVSINFYPFDAKGNRGVAAGLNNVVKVQDGEFLGGRSSVDDEFADVDFDDDVDYEEEDFLN
ncbi:hypothetical protein HMPREF0083_05331 [Aneurinibacillus aneurinilyticus ATCC 12856]|uniref:Phage-associated protein n=2 Tax=Aneurinibacillus aneurinilyticus TaxID=1391 RepID=U1WD65_ANEAE|nr:hypothetical protein HMPREF0083_05331 [Aneurinibacillus aneurinilyticus ATCC 12856]